MGSIHRWTAVAAAASLPLLTAVAPAHAVLARGDDPPHPPAASPHRAFRPPVAARQRPVKVYPVKPNKVRVPVMRSWRRPAPVWPAAGPGGHLIRISRAPAKVSIEPHAAAQAAGLTGVMFTLTSARAKAAGGSGGSSPRVSTAGRRVHISLGYSSFAGADGGGYASRLRLVELPACAATTPALPRCRVQTPIPFANDVRTSRLTADLTLPATRMVLAATTSPSGSGGDFTATPLSEAGAWAEGNSSGAFAYSYPINVPPVPGGLEPSIALNYNSQLVDGLTSSANGQASWVGDGWDYSPGFVERSYQSCAQEPPGATNWVKSGDLCWSSNNTVTLSLNGQNTTLVQDGSTGTWRAQADSNEKISYLTGTTNGTHDGGYWVITTTDGTSYYFGLNQLPGYASGDATTNSAWTAPVFATSSGQPCFNATYSASHCPQAWRWNLDYVTDSHSDAVAYYYQTETNAYSLDNATTANTTYTQAGALTTIDYGLRAGTAYSATPAGKVIFGTGQARTDVPTDLACTSGKACDVISPTFWGKFQLTSIATQALEGSALASVDSWALSQTYPATNDPTSPASLWLAGITRTGSDAAGGGTSVGLPEVKFAGSPFANRVMTPADVSSGYSIITRFRLTSITTETGGVIGVGYDTPGGSCTSGNFPAPDINTGLCYPDYWTPPGAGSPILDWFNKYVVTAVTQENTVGGGVPVNTSYSYGGAAWHYTDSTLTRSSQRTWDLWRGFHTVTTQTGASPDPVTKVVDTYFQGMDGDHQANGTTASASLSAHGSTVADSRQFTGLTFEHVVDNGTSGGAVSDTVTLPWTSAATATQAQPSPLPALQAFLTGTAETRTFTPLASGGTRESDVTYTHDADGRVTSASDVPDTADPSETTCTTTSYASNTATHLLDLVAEQQVVSVPCGSTVSLPADAVSDTLTFYDGATSLSADTPTKGDVTAVQRATSYTGSTPVYTSVSASSYDEYGRVLTAADADGRKTSTGYTPATGAEPTTETVTDPAGLVTTTTLDQARDLPVQVTNPGGYVTSKSYDGLGRLTAVWEPGRARASATANYTFGYSVSATAPSVVTTSKLNDTGGYTTSEVLYDSLGRLAETQSATPDGGRDITDKFYNSLGQVSLASDAYYTTGAPNGTIVAAPDGQVPSQTGYGYDGDGRVTRQIAYKLASETWETDTSYDGEATTVSYQNLVTGQPTGGVPRTTFTDGRGLTSRIYQYHAGVTPDPSGPASGYDQTSYRYNPAGDLTGITDAAGNTWSYSYDLASDQISATTPDTGTTTSSYDATGQRLSTTDARGRTTSFSYDADGRKVAEYDTTGGAAQNAADELASWTYDTKAKGMLTSSSTFYGGQAYTQAVIGYNSFELPTGTETIIPSGQGALAGTYQSGDTYDPDTMALTSVYTGPAGGLPAETVSTGYDTAGDQVSLGSSLWSYVSSLSYSEFGQPLQYKLGPTSSPVYLTDSYDQQTQRLAGTQVVTGSNGATVDSTGYSYDNVGDVLSESDTPSAGPAQVQCFSYGYLGRLVQAWSQGSAGCATTPSTSVEGGGAPYWDHYAYDVTGNLTSQTSTQPSGAVSTTTNSYPAPGSPQPHAAGSASVSGSGTTSYRYDAAGHLVSAASPSQSQSLSWDDAGRLSSATITPSGGAAATTTYLYNADGSLLLQADPASTTLYLSNEQLVLGSSGTVTATRYYSIGGVTVAARTSAGTVDYLSGDRQGTALLTVNASTQAVTRRYFDPYGNSIGPAAASWPGDKGFVGGTADQATGLTNLGLREYNPATESFISPDSLLTPYSPQDLDPYAYGFDSPAANSDPTGAYGCGPLGLCPNPVPLHPPNPGSGPGSNPYPTPTGGNPGSSCLIVFCGHPPAPRPAPRPVVHRVSQDKWASCSAAGTAAGLCQCPPGLENTGTCTSGPHASLGGWTWRGVAHVAIDIGVTVSAGICVAATDGGCAAFLPFIYAAGSLGQYAISGGRHTARGWVMAADNGFGDGLLATVCANLCGEGTAALIMFGGIETYGGSVVSMVSYLASPGPHTWAGLAKAAVVGGLENAPYPVDKFGPNVGGR